MARPFPLLLAASTITLAMAPAAHAGEQTSISEAIEEGYVTVLHVEALETACETFSVDESANRLATYRTLMSVEEVIHVSESDLDQSDEQLVAGESVEVFWSDYENGPYVDDNGMGCSSPEFRIHDGAKRPLVIRWNTDSWVVDSWYYDDSETSTAGDGELPPCGEDVQQAVIDELEGNDDDEDEDEIAYEPEPETAEQASAACSAVPTPALGPILALMGLAGLVRRRER